MTTRPNLAGLGAVTLASVLFANWPGLAAAEAPDTFPKIIQPFFKQHCVSCHGEKAPKGNFRLDTLVPEFTNMTKAEKWNALMMRMEAGEMPPKGKPRPPQAEVQAVTRWIADRLHATVTAREKSEKHVLPEKGNWVDHDLLFSGKTSGPSATPARLWRLRPTAYESFMNELGGRVLYGTRVENQWTAPFAYPWALKSGKEFLDYPIFYRVDEPETDALIRNAQKIAKEFFNENTRRRKDCPLAPLSAEIDEILKGKAPPTLSLLDGAIRRLFDVVLLRSPRGDEQKRYVAFLRDRVKEYGPREGLETVFAAILLTPESSFRMEMGQGKPDTHGRVMLASKEVAFAIAYALTDKRPDPELWQAAVQGKLADRDEIRRQITRILNDPTIDKPRILEFFREYFGYPAVRDVFKDDKALVAERASIHSGNWMQFVTVVLMRDTDHLIEHILEKDRHVLRELLTTSKSFVNSELALVQAKGIKEAVSKGAILGGSAGWRAEDVVYNIDRKNWSAQQPLMDLPPDQRAGILTQPSWLIAHSTNVENDAIHRGKWVREKLMGGVIPDVPITVDAKLPDELHKTLRDRMSVTRNAYCWKCHQKMDQLGLPFEMYSHIGSFRTTEVLQVTDKGDPVTTATMWQRRLQKPVNATGAIEGSGDPKLDGPVKNAVEMMHKLAASERVQQVFVRHAFRYWLGRNETLEDGPVVREAFRAYQENDGSMKALITALLTSDSFLYRVNERTK